MTIIRCSDNTYDNARMSAGGFEILAIETYHWDDGTSETEILWAKDEQPISDRDVPY